MKIDGYDLSKDIVLLDSNILMDDTSRSYVKNELVAAIKQFRQAKDSTYHIHIPKTVKQELESLRERQGSAILHQRTEAVKAYDTLETLVTRGYAKIIKVDFTGAANGFNDVAVLTMTMELRRHSDITVLTNDRNFATDLLNMNLLKSVNTNKTVRAFFVHRNDGRLQEWLLHPQLREAERFTNELKSKEGLV